MYSVDKNRNLVRLFYLIPGRFIERKSIICHYVVRLHVSKLKPHLHMIRIYIVILWMNAISYEIRKFIIFLKFVIFY